MVFRRYCAGKILSSICIQDFVKPELHYQINLIRLIKIIIRFLYQICGTDISDENNYLYFLKHIAQRRIKNPTKHLN